MQLEKYMRVVQCKTCEGRRLNAQARAVRVSGKTLVDLGAMPIGDLVPWIGTMETALDPIRKFIASELLKEIRDRLTFLLNVGLHYLTLDRSAPSLSGGEAQRIRLAGQIGSGLVGVLYILDEPSIGLHPRDNARATALNACATWATRPRCRARRRTMRAADFLVDFGPGPVFAAEKSLPRGTPSEVVANPASATAKVPQ